MKEILLLIVAFLGFSPSMAQGVKETTPGEFTRIIKLKGARSANRGVRIKPKAGEISARKFKGSSGGESTVLSIPVEITNYSPRAISTNLAHEWSGGIWVPTDFYVAALVEDWEKKMVWDQRPAYQVGNLGTVKKTVLNPGESITVDVRLNWPGTGSVPTEPLIAESVPGKHTIRFLLFFKTSLSEEYLLTETYTVKVVK